MRLVLMWISAITLIACTAAAQTKPATLAVGDNVRIGIYDLVAPGVETVKTQKVSENGNIVMPLIGQLKAEGRTEAQLEGDIADAYGRAKIIDKAQVTVRIVPPTTQPAK